MQVKFTVIPDRLARGNFAFTYRVFKQLSKFEQ